MIMPEFVKDFCREQYRLKDFLRVEVETYKDIAFTHLLKRSGLSFGYDLNFTGLDGTAISLEGYVTRALTYSIHPVKIFINGTILTDIRPKALPPPEYPEKIDLSNTKDNNE